MITWTKVEMVDSFGDLITLIPSIFKLYFFFFFTMKLFNRWMGFFFFNLRARMKIEIVEIIHSVYKFPLFNFLFFLIFENVCTYEMLVERF